MKYYKERDLSTDVIQQDDTPERIIGSCGGDDWWKNATKPPRPKHTLQPRDWQRFRVSVFQLWIYSTTLQGLPEGVNNRNNEFPKSGQGVHSSIHDGRLYQRTVGFEL